MQRRASAHGTLDALGALGTLIAAAALLGCGGNDHAVGEIQGQARPIGLATQLDDPRSRAASGRRILFGDLHVHSTYSVDAYIYALPLFGGEGVHPPADACDFARYCAGLDFFSINDHAEGLTPERWQSTVESIRECNARAGDPADPDLVAFMGWEWTQVGDTPETHFGHKNVVLRGLDDADIPDRPISSLEDRELDRAPPAWVLGGLQRLVPSPYADFLWWIERLALLPNCPRGVASPELPHDCRENAPTPEELFRKLDEWNVDALVIPHGLAWGLHAPPGARLDNQLTRARLAADRQRLLEVYSGHGNGEEYRPWQTAELERDADGAPICPAPTRDLLPCCWRAGELMRERCGDLPPDECERRVTEAKRLALQAGSKPHWVFPDTEVEDWLDCDQCRDCFKPVLTPRAGETAQYALALSRTDPSGGDPLRFRWGFMASSDDHHSRAGTGYKQLWRRGMSDSRGMRPESVRQAVRSATRPGGEPQRAVPVELMSRSFVGLFDTERTSSFLYPGGLVAVHARDRSRNAVWEALAERRVYGTSGPRILLWLELLNAPTGPAPMGSVVAMDATPRFQVRAVGSRVQRPGCAQATRGALAPERLEQLCRGECHHPGDRRHTIAAIEVVRIRPQQHPGEDVGRLIEDPWLRFECPPDPSGCVMQFEDPDFAASGRDSVYYVRALQEPTPAINGANLRTRFDAAGNPTEVAPCYGDLRTADDDDCLAPVQERAWSSPIFVDRVRTKRPGSVTLNRVDTTEGPPIDEGRASHVEGSRLLPPG